MFCGLSLALCLVLSGLRFAVATRQVYGQPFLKTVDNHTHIIGNDIWNLTIGEHFGTKLWYKGVDLVGNASGHYVSYSEFDRLETDDWRTRF
jgi:rhamnogalacturonan endolyase